MNAGSQLRVTPIIFSGFLNYRYYVTTCVQPLTWLYLSSLKTSLYDTTLLSWSWLSSMPPHSSVTYNAARFISDHWPVSYIHLRAGMSLSCMICKRYARPLLPLHLAGMLNIIFHTVLTMIHEHNHFIVICFYYYNYWICKFFRDSWQLVLLASTASWYYKGVCDIGLETAWLPVFCVHNCLACILKACTNFTTAI